MWWITYDQNSHETSQSYIPITVAGCLSHEHRVEYKVAQTQFYASLNDLVKIII